MKKEKIKHFFRIFCLFFINIILVVLIFKVSYVLKINSLEEIKVDKVTSNYISFNYVDKNDHILEINKPIKTSDFLGKRLLSDNYFEFDVSVSDKDLTKDEIFYDLVIMDLGNSIDEEYIKIYLTDQENNVLDDYEKVVPLLSTFKNDLDGKIIYSGNLNKKNNNDKFRLRIWISNKYKGDIKNILAYHIKVKINN